MQGAGARLEVSRSMLKPMHAVALLLAVAFSACGPGGVPAESLSVTVRHDGVVQVVTVRFPPEDGKTTTTCGFSDCFFSRATLEAPIKAPIEAAFRSVPYRKSPAGLEPDLSAALYDLRLDDSLGGRQLRVEAFDVPIQVADGLTITVSRR